MELFDYRSPHIVLHSAFRGILQRHLASKTGPNDALPTETQALIDRFGEVKAAADAKVFSLTLRFVRTLYCCTWQRAPKTVASSQRLTAHMNELLADEVGLNTILKTNCMCTDRGA